MEQSPWVRGACLVLLLVFVIICGVHVAGIHHHSDSDGLGLGDRLATLILLTVLGLGLIALSRWRIELLSHTRSALNEFCLAAPDVDAFRFRMVAPLRC
jgi:hypothetical protein